VRDDVGLGVTVGVGVGVGAMMVIGAVLGATVAVGVAVGVGVGVAEDAPAVSMLVGTPASVGAFEGPVKTGPGGWVG